MWLGEAIAGSGAIWEGQIHFFSSRQKGTDVGMQESFVTRGCVGAEMAASLDTHMLLHMRHRPRSSATLISAPSRAVLPAPATVTRSQAVAPFGTARSFSTCNKLESPVRRS